MAEAHLIHGFARKLGRRSEYNVWKTMRARCNNPNHKSFARYGGRGISVCRRWNSFVCFIADVGWRPSNKHSLERKNNHGNYEPSNVIWATRTVQGRNKRNNRLVTFDGQTMCLSAWAEKFGISYVTFHARLTRGIPFAEALSPLPRRRGPKPRC